MRTSLRIEYWIDNGWYVGRAKEVPGVFSQGKTLNELKRNIQDAYHLMMEEMSENEYSENIKETLVQV